MSLWTLRPWSNWNNTSLSGILGKECWDVTYSSETICALKGSSVDISCSYKHPAGHTPTSQFWFYDQQSNTEPEDLSLDHTYERRVEYTRNNSDHTLRLRDLTDEDAREYCFRFETDKGQKFIRKPGVTLSIISNRQSLSYNILKWTLQILLIDWLIDCID